MRGDELSERMLNFAARIIKLAGALPKTTVGDHICIQLVKSGTSSGANYEEARAAESKPDFSHKLAVSLKELRETKFWLIIIEKTGLIPAKRMGDIIGESEELCKILGKSLVTVRSSQCKKKN
jgi:four helix bundle protein